MTGDDRPIWRMTQCERQALKDLAALGHELRDQDGWVPEQLITLVMSARNKGGKPVRVLVTLRNRGYVVSHGAPKYWRRTELPAPTNGLFGEMPGLIPTDAIARIVDLWRQGRTNITLLDVGFSPDSTCGNDELPKNSPRRLG